MLSFKFLMAAALVTSAVEAPSAEEAQRLYPGVAPALRALAINLEIMDPREKGYLLAHAQDFAADVKLLQERFVELRDAPPVAEAVRFPGRDLVNDFLAFNRAYRQDLNARLALDTVHSEQLRAALMETDQLYQIWDSVRDARCEYYYVNVRRQALQQLRELVGDRAFCTGQLPPHVPMWRFPLVD